LRAYRLGVQTKEIRNPFTKFLQPNLPCLQHRSPKSPNPPSRMPSERKRSPIRSKALFQRSNKWQALAQIGRRTQKTRSSPDALGRKKHPCETRALKHGLPATRTPTPVPPPPPPPPPLKKRKQREFEPIRNAWWPKPHSASLGNPSHHLQRKVTGSSATMKMEPEPSPSASSWRKWRTK